MQILGVVQLSVPQPDSWLLARAKQAALFVGDGRLWRGAQAAANRRVVECRVTRERLQGQRALPR